MSDTTLGPEIAAMYLHDVEPLWKAFWFHMHLMAKNLEEFAYGLGKISDEVFVYHVSGQKNDLSKWVQEVIGDSVLASALASVNTKEDAFDLARARVAELKRVAEIPPSR